MTARKGKIGEMVNTANPDASSQSKDVQTLITVESGTDVLAPFHKVVSLALDMLERDIQGIIRGDR